jgi:glycine cleavage system H protein
MSEILENLKYAKSHEWVRLETDGTVTIGISDHAQTALGDLVFVELPAIGRTVAAEESCAVVESVKAASDIYSPIAGEVIAVNNALDDNPELVNNSPYEAGWLFKLKPFELNPALSHLLTAQAYRETVDNEA